MTQYHDTLLYYYLLYIPAMYIVLYIKDLQVTYTYPPTCAYNIYLLLTRDSVTPPYLSPPPAQYRHMSRFIYIYLGSTLYRIYLFIHVSMTDAMFTPPPPPMWGIYMWCPAPHMGLVVQYNTASCNQTGVIGIGISRDKHPTVIEYQAA